jgi:hypothetical protein
VRIVNKASAAKKHPKADFFLTAGSPPNLKQDAVSTVSEARKV